MSHMNKVLLSFLGAAALNVAGCAVMDKDDDFVYQGAVEELSVRNAYYSLENIVREKNVLYVGASAVEITPQKNAYLAGFQVGRKSTGVNDELFARSVVLSYNDTTIAFVSLDLIGFMNENVDDVRCLVSQIKGSNIDEVIISSTHTHSGPDTVGMWGPGFIVLPVGSGLDEDYMKFLYDKIVESVYRAAKEQKKARLFYASKEVSADKKISRNIHKELADDIDRTLNVVEAVDDSGKSIVVIANYGCHPEALSRNNTEFSSDFVGVLRDELEKKCGGTAVFLQGSIGCLVSVDVDDEKWKKTKYGLKEMYRIGKSLADEVELCLKTKKECVKPEIKVQRDDFLVPVENWLFQFANDVGLVAKRDFCGSVKTEMVFVDIGGVIQMMTVPGEISPSLGKKLKEYMNADQKIIIGLGQDETGYVPENFEHHALGYERTMSPGPKTRDLLLEHGKNLTKKK